MAPEARGTITTLRGAEMTEYRFTGRTFTDEDFVILDINLFGGVSAAMLKDGTWIKIAPHPDGNDLWAEVENQD